MILDKLKPGDVFVRKGGVYRYIVTTMRDDQSVHCLNLDGPNSYSHPKSEEVIKLGNINTGTKTVSEEDNTIFKPFYMCLVVGGDSPKYRHKDEGGARVEAQRLTKLTGKTTIVLKAIAEVRCVTPEFQWREARCQE